MRDCLKKQTTKERMLEMFETVASINIENKNSDIDLYFNKLKNGELNVEFIEVTPMQDIKNKYFITVKCNQQNGIINFLFWFEVVESNDDNVDIVKNAVLYDIIVKGENLKDLDREYMNRFNENNKAAIIEFAGQQVKNNPDVVKVAYDENMINLGKEIDEDTLTANDYLQHTYNTIKDKKKYIEYAKDYIDFGLIAKGINPDEKKSDPEYRQSVKELAIFLFNKNMGELNESNDYPKEIGHKFKVKKQYKLDKKRRKPVTRIDEDDNLVTDTNTNENLNIGDVVMVNGWNGEYQIRASYSERRPYLAPYESENSNIRIYLNTIPDLKLTKIKSFSDTKGGFTR